MWAQFWEVLEQIYKHISHQCIAEEMKEKIKDLLESNSAKCFHLDVFFYKRFHLDNVFFILFFSSKWKLTWVFNIKKRVIF